MLFFILTVLLSSALMILQVSVRYSEFKTRSEKVRSDFIDQQKILIQRDVNNAIAAIEYQKSLSKQKAMDIIKEQVYEAHDSALNIYTQNRSLYSEHEIQKIIIDVLRPIRFNEGQGYFFITRFDGTEMLFADRPEMENLNLLDWKDSNGKYVIRDMIKIAKEEKEGFYEYNWTKPGSEENNHRKISFIKNFAPYEWFIGTGLYIEDVENQIKKDILSYYNQPRTGMDDYIFIGQWDGLSLAGPSVGENVIEAEDVNGLKLVRELIRTAMSGGGYVSYKMPGFTGQADKAKISYTRGIPEWKWYVGSGVFVDSIETTIAEMLDVLKKEIRIQLAVVLLTIILIIFIFMIFIYRITLQLQNDSQLFIDSLNQAAMDNRRIDLDKIRFEETQLIKISGPKAVVGKEKLFTAKPIDISGLKSSKTFQVPLELRTALLELMGETVVTANVVIREKTTEKTITDIPVHLTGPESDRKVTLEPSTISVRALLPLSSRGNQAGLVEASISTEGLSVGTHRVQVKITAPEEIHIIEAVPSAVTVKIGRSLGK